MSDIEHTEYLETKIAGNGSILLVARLRDDGSEKDYDLSLKLNIKDYTGDTVIDLNDKMFICTDDEHEKDSDEWLKANCYSVSLGGRPHHSSYGFGTEQALGVLIAYGKRVVIPRMIDWIGDNAGPLTVKQLQDLFQK